MNDINITTRVSGGSIGGASKTPEEPHMLAFLKFAKARFNLCWSSLL